MIKHKEKNILAIIPARGGSKGLPGKNIKIFAGKPLIAWTIETALKSKYLNRVVVSTEDETIARISKKYGSEIIKRPIGLARDISSTHDVIDHVIDYLEKNEKYESDIIVLLQPTSPLRTVEDIDRAVDIFIENKCESVISMYEFGPSVYWSFKMGRKYLETLFDIKYLKQRRQKSPKVYIPNGAIYVSTYNNLIKYKSFYSKKILPYVMPEERSIDIDYEIDFKLAEILMNKTNGKE